MSSPTHQIDQSYSASEPRPARTVAVYWLFSPLLGTLAVLLPRRLGPYLSSASLGAAYLAHFAGWLLLVIGLPLGWELGRAGADVTALIAPEPWRLHAAWIVVSLLDSSLVFSVLPALGIALAIDQTLVWLGAMCWMPWHAAGEKRGRLYLRSAKLLLWSTSVGALAPPLAYLWAKHIPYAYDPIEFALFGGILLWWLWVVLRWGDRYAGPAEGPGFQPRALHCESCGYELTSLSVTGRCPECGRPVADSLPARRRLPAFAARRHLPDRLLAFFPTLLASLRARRFGGRLTVHTGRRAAREFAVLADLLIGALAGLALGPLIWETAAGNALAFAPSVAPGALILALCVASTGIAAIAALAFAAILLLAGCASTAGWIEPERRGVVLCYSAGGLVVPGILVIGAIAASEMLRHRWHWHFWVDVPWLGAVSGRELATMALFLPALAAGLLWLFHLRWLLRVTRWANA